MIWLRQSTASQEIPLGYFLDSTDGDTAETGLTIANTDLKIWKNGATTLANKNSGGATHIAGGIYYTVLDATDTDTLGPLVVFCHVSGALAVKVDCFVVAANVYDSLVAATDKLEVDTTLIEGSDATDQINAACDTAIADYDPPTKAELDSGLGALNDPTAAAVADAVWDEAQSGHTTAGTFGKYLDAAISGVGGAVGSGADAVTVTITRTGGSPAIADADVWVTSDAAGANVVAGTLQTDSSGQVTFMLDDGVTYYLWMQKDGEQSIQGESFVASAD